MVGESNDPRENLEAAIQAAHGVTLLIATIYSGPNSARLRERLADISLTKTKDNQAYRLVAGIVRFIDEEMPDIQAETDLVRKYLGDAGDT
jgi:ABC-type uncharacterized transport system ATPase subunit